ncbi:MAG TPA: AAA family ATPase, partial [Solirubrobacteraceae bacterium]|nr:AAA family ATPase [Solirubrobacteraceae bacterium]
MLKARPVAGPTWPLVGRVQQLSKARDALSAGAGGVVISGDPGVGKTRLARELVERAQADGAYVLWARATQSASEIPFGAFSAALPDGSRPGHDAGSMQNLLGSLRELADGREILLAVDDAQLLDGASAAFLLQSVERGLATAVATIRSDSPCPDAVMALWKDAGSVRIELPAMPDSEITQLVETALEAPLQHDAKRWIAQTSGGNVLYAQQLVDGALDTGTLVLRDGSWRLQRRPEISQSLRELIAARMGRVEAAERSALELLALGDPLRLGEATELIGSEMLTELETAGLVVALETGSGTFAVHLAHPLFGEWLAAQMPATRGREHRLRLAELISRRTDGGPMDAVRSAVWLTEAGETVPVSVLLDAARAANAAGVEVGTSFAQKALHAGAGPEASLILAAGHYVHGRASEAEVVLAAIEGAIEDPALAFRYARQRAAILEWGLDRNEEATALLARAVQWWPEPAWRRAIEILSLPFRALAGEPGALASEIEAAVEDTPPGSDARRWLTQALATDRFWAGRAIAACELLAQIPAFPLQDELEFLEFAAHTVLALGAGLDLRGLDVEMRDAFER